MLVTHIYLRKTKINRMKLLDKTVILENIIITLYYLINFQTFTKYEKLTVTALINKTIV